MNEKQLFLVRAALAALEQNATYDSDVIYAKRCLRGAIEATEQGVQPELLTLDDLTKDFSSADPKPPTSTAKPQSA